MKRAMSKAMMTKPPSEPPTAAPVTASVGVCLDTTIEEWNADVIVMDARDGLLKDVVGTTEELNTPQLGSTCFRQGSGHKQESLQRNDMSMQYHS